MSRLRYTSRDEIQYAPTAQSSTTAATAIDVVMAILVRMANRVRVTATPAGIRSHEPYE